MSSAYCAGQFEVFLKNTKENLNAANDKQHKISTGYGLERILSDLTDPIFYASIIPNITLWGLRVSLSFLEDNIVKYIY